MDEHPEAAAVADPRDRPGPGPGTAGQAGVTAGQAGGTGDQPVAVDVFWRPGCGYCSRLLRALERADVRVRLHNIWEEDEARRFVRAHNRGNETVPTVAVGALVLTNPSPRAFLEQLRTEHPDLVGTAF